MKKEIDPLDTDEYNGNMFDHVDSLLSPEEALWIRLYSASQDIYRDWTPRWEWNLYKRKCPNLKCLKKVFNNYLKAKLAQRRIKVQKKEKIKVNPLELSKSISYKLIEIFK
jgi:hypothetical protein